MNKIVFCTVLALLAIPALWSVPHAAAMMLEPPLQSGEIPWPFISLVGVTVIGAIAAIIWEMKSD